MRDPGTLGLELTTSDRRRVSEIVNSLDELWPEAQTLSTLAEIIDEGFGAETRAGVYLRGPTTRGPIGHTFGRPYHRWEGIPGAKSLPGIIAYPLDRRDTLAHRPVNDREVFAGRPELLERFRQDFLGKSGLGHQLRVTFYEGDRFLGLAGIYRPRDGRAFTERDRAMMQPLVPRLREYLRVSARFHNTQAFAGIIPILEAIDRPIFISTPRGTVVHANAMARALAPHPPTWLRDHRELKARARVHPLRIDGVGLRLVQPHVHVGYRPDLEGLPPSLRRIADGMVRGLADKEIAVELDLPLATVRTYAHRVLGRLGMNDRRQLIGMTFSTRRS